MPVAYVEIVENMVLFLGDKHVVDDGLCRNIDPAEREIRYDVIPVSAHASRAKESLTSGVR